MRNLKTFFIIGFLLFAMTGIAYSAGTVTQTISEISKGCYEVTFICTGDAANGSIPATATADNDVSGKPLLSKIIGKYLTQVKAFPTVGGTAPDAANVFVYDKHNLYLLGSEDGGGYAYEGLNLIHATLTKSCLPNLYLTRAGLHLNYYPRITGALTLVVTAQGTASANWTIVFVVEE